MSTEADLAFLNDESGRRQIWSTAPSGRCRCSTALTRTTRKVWRISTALLPDGWRERVVTFEARSAEPPRLSASSGTIW